jgi:hypothetical protein
MAANPNAISWDNEEENDGKDNRAFRGIQGNVAIDASNLQGDVLSFAPQQGLQKQSHSAINSQSFGGQQRSAWTHKSPVQIIVLELDDAPAQQQVAAAKPEANAAEQGPVDEPYTNDLRSYEVPGHTPQQVMSGLTAALVNYSQDMDIRLDEKKNLIEGVVFVENYYGIKFSINIWAQGKNSTRFELTRNSGDALATSKFLGDIKTKFFIDIQEESDAEKAKKKDDDNKDQAKEPEFNKVSLSLDAANLDLKDLIRQLTQNELKEDEDSISKQELDDVTEALSNNEVESVDELQFLHERLKENGAIGKDIANHEQLVKTIISSAMKNKDICVVRGCLLILEQLCQDDKIGLLLVEQYALFENLATLLKHEYALIKNYSVRLLARLSKQKKWNMDGAAADQIKELVQKYQDVWKDSILSKNGFLNEEMFGSIYEKLDECKDDK